MDYESTALPLSYEPDRQAKAAAYSTKKHRVLQEGKHHRPGLWLLTGLRSSLGAKCGNFLVSDHRGDIIVGVGRAKND